MHIRCPHCHNAIEIVEDSSFRDVECPSCGSHFNLVGGDAPTESGPTKPRTLGHFELIEQLGVGHFGAVWKAKDTTLDRFVAVKIPRKDQLDEADTEKFFREARAAAQLRHPNIVGVHEVGRDGDTIFIASDYVEGATLKDWLGGQPLPPREAAKLCAKIANALHVAHEAGVIHRDLKPGNIMMDMDDEPHIMDFGLAKRESGEITVTIEGALLGTPAYMPPEQAADKGHEADRRSDVYSLGVILFEMLTGELPFRGEKRMLMVQIQRDEPTSPRKLNGNIPRDLETICLKCLEKSPDKRYKSSGELTEELSRFLDGKPIEARRIGGAAKGWRWAKRNPAIAGSAVTVICVLLVAIAAISYWATVAASKSEQAVRSLVEALANTPPAQVPEAIDALRPFRADAIGMLQQQFDATSGRRQLNTAYGLAAFGNVERQFLIKSIDGSESGDCDNLVLALACDRNAALDDLRDAASAATSNRDWELKTRLATVALFLNDASIAAEMLRGEADKNQTPQRFPNPLETLREQLASTSKMPVAPTGKMPAASISKMPVMIQMAFRLQRATACYYLDRPRHALEDLNQLADESSQALLLQALCLAREGKADEAAEAADKLAEAVKDQRYASYAASGRILSQAWLGNTDQADRQFEELLEQGKDDALAQYNGACIAAQLARIQADADPTEAARLKKRALELLRRAFVELGYKGSMGLDNDPDLAPLYDDPEFQALAFELMPPVQAFDPVERTEFIKEFSAWCGEIERLVGVLEETNNAHLRSGMSLAIGGSERPSAKAKEAWGRVFTRWYQNAPDSGTHSAAAWALRQWPLSVPPTTFTDEPSPSRDWWHASEDLVMVRIPSGHLAKFSSPQSVRVDEFWLSDREVTVRLFRKFIADTEYAAKYPGEVPSDWDGEDSRVSPGLDHPVQQVSWYDAVMFCNWLSRSNDLDPYFEIAAAETTVQDRGRKDFRVTLMEEADGFRLPTADAWEYACRASTTTSYACGNDDDNLRDYAVFGASRAEMCGSKQCNAWGLFGMHGNAWEWCSESYDDYFYFYAKSPKDYPRGRTRGSYRVYRGGSWDDDARYCQSSGRSRSPRRTASTSWAFVWPEVLLPASQKARQPASKWAEPRATAGRRVKGGAPASGLERRRSARLDARVRSRAGSSLHILGDSEVIKHVHG